MNVDVVDATTYGVETPGADGRAGMAAVVGDDRFDLAEFRDGVSRRLPAYARPAMVRFCTALETFKQKTSAGSRGIRSAPRGRSAVFQGPMSGAYRPLDAASHARILDGRL